MRAGRYVARKADQERALSVRAGCGSDSLDEAFS
jgi:hypothetical protein